MVHVLAAWCPRASLLLDRTFETNVYAIFYLCRAAVPHMKRGGSIINTVSVNADSPKPKLLAHSATKGAIQNMTGGLAPLFVMLASDQASYVSGATIAATGGVPIL